MCNHFQLSQPCECLLIFSYNANFAGTGTLSRRIPKQCCLQEKWQIILFAVEMTFNAVQLEMPGKQQEISGFLSLQPLSWGNAFAFLGLIPPAWSFEVLRTVLFYPCLPKNHASFQSDKYRLFLAKEVHFSIKLFQVGMAVKVNHFHLSSCTRVTAI